MSQGNQHAEDLPGDGIPSEPEENTSGSEQADELTVEDILAAAQDASTAGNPDATENDETDEGEEPTDEVERSYLDDLRRLTAEYANYRKRTEANAELDKLRTTAAVVTALLPVLDDLDRAEQHGDLVEGSAFATIAQKVRGTLERMGLEGFGEKGEPFDPQVHEAIAQVPVPGVEGEPTVLDVIECGYRIGEVELRPAKVAVAVAADG